MKIFSVLWCSLDGFSNEGFYFYGDSEKVESFQNLKHDDDSVLALMGLYSTLQEAERFSKGMAKRQEEYPTVDGHPFAYLSPWSGDLRDANLRGADLRYT